MLGNWNMRCQCADAFAVVHFYSPELAPSLQAHFIEDKTGTMRKMWQERNLDRKTHLIWCGQIAPRCESSETDRSMINYPPSASCGSFGSGLHKRDWSEMRVDLRVRTGDQASFRISTWDIIVSDSSRTRVWKFRSVKSTNLDRWRPEPGQDEDIRCKRRSSDLTSTEWDSDTYRS